MEIVRSLKQGEEVQLCHIISEKTVTIDAQRALRDEIQSTNSRAQVLFLNEQEEASAFIFIQNTYGRFITTDSEEIREKRIIDSLVRYRLIVLKK